MTCDQTIEFLPWLLNGSLEEAERQEVMRHLADCAQCRSGLAETRAAWETFAAHVPVADLVAHASGEAPAHTDSAMLERHVASCAQCAAELELVTTSHRLAVEDEEERVALFRQPASSRPRSLPGWRAAALAAGLTALVTGSGWLASLGSGMLQPRINGELVDVRPGADVPRGTSDAEPTRVSADRDTSLLLPARNPPAAGSPAPSIEMLNAAGKVVFRHKGLRLSTANNDYDLWLPAGYLHPGTYTLRVFTSEHGRRRDLESYEIHAVPRR